MQLKFIENLRFRIDARLMKIMKLSKSMSIGDLIEKTINELGMRMSLPLDSEDQMGELRDQIDKRV